LEDRKTTVYLGEKELGKGIGGGKSKITYVRQRSMLGEKKNIGGREPVG